MTPIDLLSVKLFVTVATEGNMSKAAEREHISLAALSKRIARLEEVLQVSLFIRERQGVKLTAAGGAFLQHAREMLYSVQRLTSELSDYAKGIRGYVRVAASTSSMMQFLPEELKEFLERNPSIRVDLQQRASMDVANFVRDGVADIGIFAPSFPADDLQAFPYHVDNLVVVVPPDHPLAAQRATRLRDILRFDLIELEEGSAIHALLAREAGALALPLKIRVRVRSFDVMCRMIQCSIGIGILPDLAAKAYLKAMEIRQVALDEPWAQREVRIHVRNVHALTPSAKQLMDFLVWKAAAAHVAAKDPGHNRGGILPKAQRPT